jgi:serine/threonine-protein kinase
MNARMEEMSFRSGVAVFASVLALTGTGIALAVTLGGSHQAAAAAPKASATSVPVSTAPPSSAEAVPSPSVSPSAAPGTPAYGSAPAVADASSPEPTRRATSAHPSAAPTSPWPTYRPMSLNPSNSVTSPEVGPPPWWTPP